MIPKIIIQTSVQKPPQYIIDSILHHLPDYKYYHFTDSEILDYLNKNIIDEFPNLIEKFKSIKNGAHKADFFRYYFLYLNGGIYIDSDAMIKNNLEDFINDYNFFTVKSCLNNDSLFNGFIGCSKNNPIIYNALQHIINIDIEELNKNYFIICKYFYNIIKLELNQNNKEKILLLEEKKTNTNTDYIYISSYYNDNIILKHYYNKDSIVESNINIIKKKNNKKIIGITLNMPDKICNLFSNGINQNAIYLGELFANIDYEVYFIVNCNLNEKKDLINNLLYHKNFNIVNMIELYTINFDIIFFLSFVYSLKLNKTLRYSGVKCVYYNCGNIYFNDGEKILYNNGNPINNYKKDLENIYDEIWLIPQSINTNLYYLKTLYRTKTIGVPFVWSSKAIDFSAKACNIENIDDLLYKKKDTNKIAIFEPNLSLLKWCIPALLVCENSYRINKNIDHVYLNNTMNHRSLQMSEVQKIINSLDLHHDKKITSEARFNTLAFMKDYASYVVSFQMENNLNYLYFDLAWMGYPIIHNAKLIKNIGYYYDEFNYDNGAKVLNNALENHDFDSYIKKNRELISKYTPQNIELQNKYKILINNLLEE
jgi:hypothetical protein